MTTLRLPQQTADLAFCAAAGALTLFAAYVAVHMSARIGLGLVVLGCFFGLCVLGFLYVPQWAVALMIPLFAFVPAAKIFVSPRIGPIKDVVTLAAIVAAVVLLVFPAEGQRPIVDRWVLLCVGLLLGLYVVNVGGGHGVAWAQGVRLTAEPLLLLIVGLTLQNPRRTFRFATISFVATAAVAAAYGLLQQAVGQWTLVGWGYSFNSQVRTYAGHLRSFGTFDDPFIYAAFLLFAVACVLFVFRRGLFAYALGGLLVAGVAVSFVRTAALIGLALLGLWLARKGLGASAVLIVAASVAAMGALLVTSSSGTQTTSYSSGSSTLTLNGRVSAWKAALGAPSEWPFGRGVGKVGTAAQRATYTLVAGPNQKAPTRAVDSGYLATIADVGLVGVAVLLGLFGRLLVLAWGGMQRGRSESWFAAAMLAVMMLDAVTRSSFTGFPTAFLGLPLVGIALAAAAEQDDRAAALAP